MHTRVNRIPPALKHGAYSATAVLPGESRAAFEKLHRGLIAEFAPSGVMEDDIVADMARLMWRKQNLGTLRTAEFAQGQWSATWGIRSPIAPFPLLCELSEEDKEKAKERMRAAQDRVRKELGDTFEVIEIGDAATFDGLTKELEIQERLDAAINRCIKELVMVRGVKSITVAPPLKTPKRITGPSKGT